MSRDRVPNWTAATASLWKRSAATNAAAFNRLLGRIQAAVCLRNARRGAGACLLTIVAGQLGAAAGMAADYEQRGPLENQAIVESSGLAHSPRHPELLWTHNDSGGQPELFALDLQGKHVGTCHLQDVQPTDWEDMGSFRMGEEGYLFVADVGDNLRKRAEYQILVVREPAHPEATTACQTVAFRYEDGPHDCEAVGYDAMRREFILIEKQLGLRAKVYAFGWSPEAPPQPRLARAIGSVPVPLATALDISADGQKLAIATYGPGFQWIRQPDEDWPTAFSRAPQPLVLPPRRQGEAICFSPSGATLYLTSEKKPCPLFVLPLGK